MENIKANKRKQKSNKSVSILLLTLLLTFLYTYIYIAHEYRFNEQRVKSLAITTNESIGEWTEDFNKKVMPNIKETGELAVIQTGENYKTGCRVMGEEFNQLEYEKCMNDTKQMLYEAHVQLQQRLRDIEVSKGNNDKIIAEFK